MLRFSAIVLSLTLVVTFVGWYFHQDYKSKKNNQSACVAPESITAEKIIIPPTKTTDYPVMNGQNPTYQPKTTYDYRLGLMIERTRIYRDVKYPDGWRNVPIINGYIPNISETVYPNGDRHILYDYRRRVRYDYLDSSNRK